MRLRLGAVGLPVLLHAITANSQPPQIPAPAVPRSAAPTICCMAPSGTPVEIELTQVVSSRTAKSDDPFSLKLSRDIVLNGKVLVAAGAPGCGQVVDTARAGLGGRPGKLVLAARFLKVGGARLPLRGFRLFGTGSDDSKAAAVLSALPYVGLMAIGVRGGNIDFAEGTRAMAKVAADTVIQEPSATSGSPPSDECYADFDGPTP